MKTTKPPLRRTILAAGSIIGIAFGGVLAAVPADAATTVTLDNLVLTVNGDDASNTLVVGSTFAGTITLNGTPVLGGKATLGTVNLVRINGGAGNDTLRIDEFNNVMPQAELNGGDGNDHLVGGSKADILHGGSGADSISGNDGADTISGDEGNDLVVGGRGDDTVTLGAGDDQFTWNPGDGNDKLDGDTGSDSLRFNGSDGVDGIDAFPNGPGRAIIRRNSGDASPTQNVNFGTIEQLYVTTFKGEDAVTFQDLAGTGVRSVGLVVTPRVGDETRPDQIGLILSNGSNRVRVSGSKAAGGVTLSGAAATVRISGAEVLRVTGGFGKGVIDASTLVPGTVNLTEDGGAGNDTLIGSAGNDQLFGNAGDDRLEGRGGVDILDGGTGNNVIIP